MARTPKDAIVLVLDCGRSMSLPYGPQQEGTAVRTRFDCAKDAIRLYLQQKMMWAPKDEIGLVCFGTEGTDNDCNAEQGGYEHVVAARDIHVADVDFAKHLDTLEASEEDSEIIDALIVACDMLTKATQGKKYRKHIFVFSDGNCNIVDQQDAIQTVTHLNDNEVKFRFVGIEMFGDSVGGATQQETTTDNDRSKTDRQKETETFVEDFCDKCADGKAIPSSQLLEMLHTFKNKQVSQISKARLDLEITPFMRIPTWVYVKTKEETLPSLKSFSSVAPPESDGVVRTERSYFPVDEVDQEEVPLEDRTKAFQFGKQLVPVTTADLDALKYASSDRKMVVLGSIIRSNAERQLMLANVECVAAEPHNADASVALLSLVVALRESNAALVVNYVWRKASVPRLALLTPSETKCCLYLNYMPFSEDIRRLRFPELPQATEDQLKSIDNFMDAMSLVPTDKNDLETELLEPTATYNPTLQRFFQFIMMKALDPDIDDPPPLDPKLERLLEVDPRLASRATRAVDKLKEVFPLEKVEKAANQRKRAWKDIAAAREAWLAKAPKLAIDELKVESCGDTQTVDDDLADSGPSQREATDSRSEPQLSAEQLRDLETMAISTAQPVRDFKRMMAVTAMDMTTRAIRLMEQLIERLVNEGTEVHLQEKALQCLTALRAGCVEDKEGTRYNNFLEKLRDLCENQGARQQIWRQIGDADLRPISSIEDHLSEVAEEDAKRYFSKKIEKASVRAEKEPTLAGQDDEEDLLDLIE